MITITPNGSVALGYYSITFTSPVTNLLSTTAPLSYNVTVADIQAALYALTNWNNLNLNTVMVSRPLTAATTFTFARNWYADDFATQITVNTLVVNNISIPIHTNHCQQLRIYFYQSVNQYFQLNYASIHYQ